MNTKEMWFSILTHCSAILFSTEFSLVVFPKHRQKVSLQGLGSRGSLCGPWKGKFPLREFQDITDHPDLCPSRASLSLPCCLSFNFLVRWGKGKHPKLFFSHCGYRPKGWHRNPSPKSWQTSMDGNGGGWEWGQAEGSPNSNLTGGVSGTVQLLQFVLLILPLWNAG